MISDKMIIFTQTMRKIIMAAREFGWVQNPNLFGKLKNIVQIFVPGTLYHEQLINTDLNFIYDQSEQVRLRKVITAPSPITISYDDLVGARRWSDPKSKKRADEVAVGLGQLAAGKPASMRKSTDSNKHYWTDNWSSDGFVNWALTLNFLHLDEKTDMITLTELGLRFASTNDGKWKSVRTYISSSEELDIMKTALLSYPPAVRVLRLLKMQRELHGKDYFTSKFFLGHNVGFYGEGGFTSYDEEDWFELLHEQDPSKKQDFKTDKEGSGDKFSRTISGWLIKVGYVEQGDISRNVDGFMETMPHGYKITVAGLEDLKLADGVSKNGRLEKFVSWHMFATNVTNKDYIRARRAWTLKALTKSSTLKGIETVLSEQGLNDGHGVINNDIKSLISFGINIQMEGKNVKLKDSINNFEIPEWLVKKPLEDSDIKNVKNRLMNKLPNLDPADFGLVDLAFAKAGTQSENTKMANEFEARTVEFMKQYFKLSGVHLGGGNRPDGALYDNDKYGIILDTKAYSQGYKPDTKQVREMSDYIQNVWYDSGRKEARAWWKNFPANLDKTRIHFIWVAGTFKSGMNDMIVAAKGHTAMTGGAITVEKLLTIADNVVAHNYNYDVLSDKFMDAVI